VAWGGFVLGQTLHAATTSIEKPELRPHSLHCYFLRPMVAGVPVNYSIEHVRDGRSFTTRHVEAKQNGASVCTMMASFTADTEGYEYELDVLGGFPNVDDYEDDVWEDDEGPWMGRTLGPTTPRANGTYDSTERHFIRVPTPLPDDPMLHAAVVAMITDMTHAGSRPLKLEFPIDGIVSLDHAIWFHRPLRADEWIYYDMHSLLNAGGRGYLRGTLHGRDGRVAVSVAQEQLLRVV